MRLRDDTGLGLTGATPEAMQHYEQALADLQCYRNDPVAGADAALALSPDFTMAHVLRAWLHLLGTEPAGLPVARDSLAAAAALPANGRERGHIAALGPSGRGPLARRRPGARGRDDRSAARRAGAARRAPDRLLHRPQQDAARPHRPRPAGVEPRHARASFGARHARLRAGGDRQLRRRRSQGRLGVELEPHDGWSQHAVAHVLEMQGRQAEGIAWMRANPAGWAEGSFLAVHNWWHLALYHLEIGEIAEVLALYDDQIYGAQSGVVIEMVDASALLWRLMLRGIDVGDRWNAVAANWAPVAAAGNYAFNDAHAVMAFVGAGRLAEAEAVVEAPACGDGRAGGQRRLHR